MGHIFTCLATFPIWLAVMITLSLIDLSLNGYALRYLLMLQFDNGMDIFQLFLLLVLVLTL